MNNPRLFFPYEEEDDLFDLYEDRLFEDKQFFITKPILSTLFENRIEKMLKRETAFRSITETNSPQLLGISTEVQKANSIPEAYRLMQKNRADIFKEIYAAKDIPAVIEWVGHLLVLFSRYSSQFALPHPDIDTSILLSKEPDPVVFAQAIQSFEIAGGKNVEDLQQLTYTGKETLLNEAKRLSLWRKKELENEKL